MFIQIGEVVVSQCRVLPFAIFHNELPLGNIKCIGSEKSTDLLLQLHQVLSVEGALEHLGREDDQRLVEPAVGALVGHDLRFELHEGATLFHRCVTDGPVFKHNSGVCVGHPSCLLIEFLLLGGQHLWHG